jgi:hypothetical protein
MYRENVPQEVYSAMKTSFSKGTFSINTSKENMPIKGSANK